MKLFAAAVILGFGWIYAYPKKAAAQAPCPAPVLAVVDSATGKEIQSIGFGDVPIGQIKTVQVKILNPIGSPCNLVITTAQDGTLHIEGVRR